MSEKNEAIVQQFILELQLEDERHQDVLDEEKVECWIQAALEADVTSAEITVRVVDEKEGLALNNQYRGRAYATNVLTFDYAHAPAVMADLIICAPVVEREAKELEKTLEAHYAHLLVHGMLHAQGWDHEEDAEAEEMECFESQVMVKLGFFDPYSK